MKKINIRAERNAVKSKRLYVMPFDYRPGTNAGLPLREALL